MKTLEQVLADYREDAQVLRAHGHGHDAQLIEKILHDVELATVDVREWLSEGEARLRSGKSAGWLRARFPEWAAAGHARLNPNRPRERQYRQIVVPRRANPDAAREAGFRGERFGA